METDGLIPLLTVAILAFVVPMVTSSVRQLHVPTVVGEIFAGIVVGRYGLGLIPEEPGPWVEFFSLFGLAYLMYMSGLSINFSALRRARVGSFLSSRPDTRGSLRRAVWLFVGSLVLSLLATGVMSAVGLSESPLLLAAVLSTSAIGVVPPLLKETGHDNTALGQTLLLASVFAGFVAMVLVTVLAVFYSGGLGHRLLLLLLLLVVGVAATALLGRTRRIRVWIRRKLDRLAHSTAQLPVRGSFVLMLTFMVLAAKLGGAMILGAFLGGVVASWLSGEDQPILTIKLDAIGYGFFIPVFFIALGARLDLSVLTESVGTLLLAPALLVAALAVKLIPTHIVLHGKDLTTREIWAVGFLLATRLTVVIVATEIGLEVGAFDPALHSALVLMAVATATICPIVFIRLLPPRVRDVTNLDLSPFLDFLLGTSQGEHGQIRVREEAVAAHSELSGQTLVEANIGATTGASIIGIRRPDGRYVSSPDGNTVLHAGDILLALGTDEELEQLHWMIWW